MVKVVKWSRPFGGLRPISTPCFSGGASPPRIPLSSISPNMSSIGHDACTMIIVHACTMIIVHVCSLIIIHACIRGNMMVGSFTLGSIVISFQGVRAILRIPMIWAGFWIRFSTEHVLKACLICDFWTLLGADNSCATFVAYNLHVWNEIFKTAPITPWHSGLKRPSKPS